MYTYPKRHTYIYFNAFTHTFTNKNIISIPQCLFLRSFFISLKKYTQNEKRIIKQKTLVKIPDHLIEISVMLCSQRRHKPSETTTKIPNQNSTPDDDIIATAYGNVVVIFS